MLVSFSIQLSSWWCLFLFFNLVFYHLKYFLWRKCRKICKKFKDLYFRFICVLLKILGELEQNRQTGTLRFLGRSVNLVIFGDYIFVMPFPYPAHIANSAFFAIVPQAPCFQRAQEIQLHGCAPYSFCSSELELQQVKCNSQCSRLSKLPALEWGCFLIFACLKRQTVDVSSSEST